MKLNLSDIERRNLRKSKVKISDLNAYDLDELEVLLNSTKQRAKELFALIQFQSIPSIGIKFAEDIIFMGYYSLTELKNKDGATLTDEYELKKGYWIDPCFEDQCRLLVYFANTNDSTKNWWDFTKERKIFREKNGYPTTRPNKAWHQTLGFDNG